MNKYNAEGYADPTAYGALSVIEKEEKAARPKFRPLVYICSRFAGDVPGNTEKAKEYSRFAVDNGAIPVAPHLLFPQFMDEGTERDLALFMGMVLLCRCAEIWVFGENRSEGMKAEIDKAVKRRMTVRYFTENCEEVIQSCGN